MNPTVFDSFPVLKTSRLTLRAMVEDDAPGVYAFNSSLENLAYVARVPFETMEEGLEKTRAFMSGFETRTGFWWSIIDDASGEMVGYCGLFDVDAQAGKAEIGYGLLKDWWGRGLASEAVKAMVDFALGVVELHRIYGYVCPKNAASSAILQRLGFEKEGTLRDHSFARGRYFDMDLWALVQDE